jgi:hypothetical protein
MLPHRANLPIGVGDYRFAAVVPFVQARLILLIQGRSDKHLDGSCG